VATGQAMLKQGGVGFLGATKVALGMPGWDHPNDGSSQSLDYYFTTSVISGDYTQGEAHQRALREMYTKGLWYQVKYEMFEWGALWGNPDLGMTPIGDSPQIQIGDITSDLININVAISNVGEAEANDVEWNITIKGGILGLINVTAEDTIDSIAIDEEIIIQTNELILGLGIVNIIVTADIETKTAQGLIFGPFILV